LYSLKNVTFETLAGEKIGIVGRTGAGKTSLFSSLFRLTDICEGQIYLDTMNIRNVPLKKLRYCRAQDSSCDIISFVQVIGVLSTYIFQIEDDHHTSGSVHFYRYCAR